MTLNIEGNPGGLEWRRTSKLRKWRHLAAHAARKRQVLARYSRIRTQVMSDVLDGSQETREIHSIKRKDLKPETLGLTLAEGKAILKDIQQIVVQQQVSSGLAPCRDCPDCGKPRRRKGYHDLSLRTVFGHLRVKRPRLHGNVFQAVKELQGLEMDGAPFETKDETARKLLQGIEELHTYVERNQAFIPNYGERYRNGERMASGFVESAVNQVIRKRMVKRQQMGRSQRGAHLLLQIRTRVLDEQWEATFRSWYPAFRPIIQAEVQNAA